MDNTPDQKQHNLNLVDKKLLSRGIIISLGSIFVAFVIAAAYLGSVINQKYRSFLQAADLTHSELVNLVKASEPESKTQKLTFLVLGVDEVINRQNDPKMTDTIMLVRLNSNPASLNIVSLPRDLWSEPYQTKINALYQYGSERNPANPTAFPKEVISKMTGVDIDAVFVIELKELAALIDSVGGIKVDVKQGFTDKKFPRADVDIRTETDPEQLYETVVFKKGLQTMDGERALKYIRSRQSENEEIGNDLARAQRQQQVIKALINKISTPIQYWQDPALAGRLFKFYKDHYNQYYEIEALLETARELEPQSMRGFNLFTNSPPVADDDSSGVIKHPKNSQDYQNLWVYTITDERGFKNFVQSSLVPVK